LSISVRRLQEMTGAHIRSALHPIHLIKPNDKAEPKRSGYSEHFMSVVNAVIHARDISIHSNNLILYRLLSRDLYAGLGSAFHIRPLVWIVRDRRRPILFSLENFVEVSENYIDDVEEVCANVDVFLSRTYRDP